ncbi:uncharacterized protein AtWU_04746 [Aspergillus tubingensis]|uniref:uncharacterized protein n=1 Tax=Aspergillus tubingensis TaxID=5068 RepID=UPI0015797445|nr:uncharacterized protein AtWU_04746 [Aspergillus tubingensis]GFN14946.1 hypothetical protein AtWU_04746 [Aspergillus tubingensis]
MRFGFISAISTLVILPLGQCRPFDSSCSQLQTLDTHLESLIHFMNQDHTDDQSVYPNEWITKLHNARPLIESLRDLARLSKDQQCHGIEQEDMTISRRQATTSPDLLATILENESGILGKSD